MKFSKINYELFRCSSSDESNGQKLARLPQAKILQILEKLLVGTMP